MTGGGIISGSEHSQKKREAKMRADYMTGEKGLTCFFFLWVSRLWIVISLISALYWGGFCGQYARAAMWGTLVIIFDRLERRFAEEIDDRVY